MDPMSGAGSAAGSLPPEAIALATRMYDAARTGDVALLQQALAAGLPANMTNEKGDTLVRFHPLPSSRNAPAATGASILPRYH